MGIIKLSFNILDRLVTFNNIGGIAYMYLIVIDEYTFFI